MKKPGYAKNDEFMDRGLETFNQKKLLLREIKSIKNRKVKILEIGCGKGILLCQLQSMFNNIELNGLNLNRYHGVKKQGDFIINAKKKNIILKNNNLPKIHFGNATKLAFKNGYFDIIISQVTFIHIKNKAKAIEEACRTLKTGGLALISLGSYSIKIGKIDNKPKFYKNLDRQLGKDYNPKFLIRNDIKYVRLSRFINTIGKLYDIKLWTHKFQSKTQRAKGFWLIIRKRKNDTLKLNLQYLSKESKELTSKYSKRNPANFGVIDVYRLKD